MLLLTFVVVMLRILQMTGLSLVWHLLPLGAVRVLHRQGLVVEICNQK